VQALFAPQAGDVFVYRSQERYLVVSAMTPTTMTLLYFNRATIDSPFEAAERRTVRPETFAEAYLRGREVDPTDTLDSRITLVSRGLHRMTEDWTCAGCPVQKARVNRMGQFGARVWLKRMGWWK